MKVPEIWQGRAATWSFSIYAFSFISEIHSDPAVGVAVGWGRSEKLLPSQYRRM
jgi:hypothetical protein